jgi:hypothetical protein
LRSIAPSYAAEIKVTEDPVENKDPAAPDWARHLFYVRVEGTIEKGDGDKFERIVSKLPLLEPIREVWIHDKGFTASRLSMMRIMARRTKAATVGA